MSGLDILAKISLSPQVAVLPDREPEKSIEQPLDLRKEVSLDLRKEVLPSVVSPEVSTPLEIICTPELTEEDDAIWVDSTPEPAAPEEESLQGFLDIYN